MLLKYTHAQKRIKQAGIGKPQRTPGGMVRLSSGLVTAVPKIHRKVIKAANKRPGGLARAPAPSAVKREQISDPCDNSNDSGLGFDHHLDFHHASLLPHSALPLRFSDKEAAWPTEESSEVKRRRLEIKLESDDANDNFTFPETVRQPTSRTLCVPVRGRSRVVVPVTLTSQLTASSHNGITQLLIVCQPEQQHRARYQTEGSRGAVKDRTGNSFPIVKLVGYERPATLQVFIGTDQGRVAPHMFYQACRVSGKNSTPCVEKKIDGTIVIEVDIEPSKDMVVTCDCVGILKERNVDVEHRFPEEGSGRSKKKSTRCRMVFRTSITHPDGSQETLQVASQPIVCTQPPGVPEICKKSLVSCSVRGGQELFVLGKNFLKDTRVVFQEGDGPSPVWAQAVQPDKEFLQQSHLVCVVPPYRTPDISEPVSVRLVVESSGKASEPHSFLYLPVDTAVLAAEGNIANSSVVSQGGSTAGFAPHLSVPPALQPPLPFMVPQTSTGAEEKVHSSLMWDKPVPVEMMMPPPPCLPIALRRSSVQMIVPDPLPVPEDLKREIPESVDPPKPMATVSDLSGTQQPSLDTFRRFVSNNSLPSINVGSYLSNIESTSVYTDKLVKPQVMSEMPRIVIPSPTSTGKSIFSGDSSNLLTTVEPVLVNRSVMTFGGRDISVDSSASQSPQENLSVIVSSSMIQKSPNSHLTKEGQQQKQINEPQNNGGLDLLISSAMNNRGPTMTERLDAFVNSAAESHISPNPSSPISMTSVITENSVLNPVRKLVVNGTNDMNKIQEAEIQPMMQTPSLPISPHISPHNGSSNLNEGSLCSLLNPHSTVQAPSQSSSAQIQAAFDHHLNTQSASASQGNMSNLIQSPSQVTMGQPEAFTNLRASIEQQLSSRPGTSPHTSHTDINNLMQSPQEAAASQVQALSNLQASLEHQLSPQTVSSTQINHPDLSNLLQTPSQVTKTQEQDLSNLQVTLEQQLSSQTISSSKMNHSDLSNLIRSSPQDSRSGVQDLSNIQVSLEHTSQTINSTQMIHSESVQPSNLSLNELGVMQTPSANEVQALSDLQTSLGCHLSSQVIDSVQSNHESLTNGSISLNGLNSSVSTSSQIQSVVSQAHALSNFPTSLEHLSSQVMGSQPTILPNSHSPNSLHSSLEDSSRVSTNQAQTFSNLQISFENLTSLRSTQPNHDSVPVGGLSLNNPGQASPRVQVVVTEAQALSNLQASLERHLNTQVMGTSPSPESMMPLERLTNAAQPSHLSPDQTLSNLQISIDQLSSQVLTSSQPGHSESLSPDNISINNSRSVDLMSSQAVNISNSSPTSSPVMLSSPTSHHSTSSVLTSPAISLSSSPTMALSPTNLNMNNSQPMEINSSDIVLCNSQTLLATDLSMNNPSTLSLTSAALHMQNLQSSSVQQSGISQFEQMTSNMSQSLPVAMSPYEQQQQQHLQDVSKEPERKENSGYMMQGEAAGGAAVPQVQSAVVGMPLPHDLTQMSEHDLISYINPSCFDAAFG